MTRLMGVDGGGEEEEDDVNDFEWGVFDSSQENKRPRVINYTQLEDENLIKAWESISLDSIHDNDQIGKRYWQRVVDKFFQLMSHNGTTIPHTYRSLQVR